MPERSLKQIIIDREPRAQTFYDELFYSAEVCSHCFQRLRDVTVYEYEGMRGGVYATHKTHHPDLLPGAIRGHDDRVHDDYGSIRTWHPQTYCGECGHTPRADRDTYSHDELIDAAEGIADRLGSLGHAIDAQTIRAGINALGTKRELQGHDTEILAWATGRALRLADGPPTDTREVATA